MAEANGAEPPSRQLGVPYAIALEGGAGEVSLGAVGFHDEAVAPPKEVSDVGADGGIHERRLDSMVAAQLDEAPLEFAARELEVRRCSAIAVLSALVPARRG